jgi:uncharacterized membrane protein
LQIWRLSIANENTCYIIITLEYLIYFLWYTKATLIEIGITISTTGLHPVWKGFRWLLETINYTIISYHGRVVCAWLDSVSI